MADKKQSKGEKSVVTRIKASDSAPRNKTQKQPEATDTKVTKVSSGVSKKTKAEQKAIKKSSSDKRNPFKAFLGYFKGAWFELKQVRWPTRGATWSMTGAVLIFTAIMAALILLLDAGFQLLFDQII